jgi:cob(I)alamin adenosyltransferase
MTSRLYTGYGDKGCTFTRKNPKTPKHDKLINLIGELDELNSHIGYLVYLLEKKSHQEKYALFQMRIQSLIFHIGAFLVYNTSINKEVLDKAIATLEYEIDAQEKENEPITNFILPNGTQAASFAHICRAKTRSVERNLCSHIASQEEVIEINGKIQVFINRLSDYFFSLARTINRINNKKEFIWREDSIEYDF